MIGGKTLVQSGVYMTMYIYAYVYGYMYAVSLTRLLNSVFTDMGRRKYKFTKSKRKSAPRVVWNPDDRWDVGRFLQSKSPKYINKWPFDF